MTTTTTSSTSSSNNSNPTISTMLAHRSIRRYTDAPVREADILEAVRAGQAASTSSAVQSYCIIRVRDQKTREALIDLTGGQDKVAQSGAFFVICGDTRRHRIAAKMHGEPYEAHLEGFLLAVIDATLFAQNFSLALESTGYGICYIGGLRNELAKVDELLAIPEGIFPLYGMCVGVPAEDPAERPRLGPEAVLFDDRYPDDDAMQRMMAAYDERYLDYLDERGVSQERRQAWTAIMAAKFSRPQRTDLSRYYRSKGADLT